MYGPDPVYFDPFFDGLWAVYHDFTPIALSGYRDFGTFPSCGIPQHPGNSLNHFRKNDV
jgi:hypothetical protein